MEGLQSLLLLLVLLYYFAHALDSSCSGQSLLICVAGRSIFCGAFSNFPLPPTLYFPLLISATGTCLCICMGTHGWLVRFCQTLVQTPSWSWKLQDVLRTQPPLSDAKFKLT